MRRVRMLVVCLAALFAVSATTFAASPALAGSCNKECKAQEKQEKEFKENKSTVYAAFQNCPLENPEVALCAAGSSFDHETLRHYKTNKASGVSYFTAGKVTVELKNPILLQGGMVHVPESQNPNYYYFVPAANNVPTIQPVQQPGPLLKDSVNTALLSTSELERYNYWENFRKDRKTYAVVEAAGPIEALKVDIAALALEEGPGFVFPVKVHLVSPFAGENCYVGSDEHPIDVAFTTGKGAEGLVGSLGSLEELTMTPFYGSLMDWQQRLVSEEYSSPGVEGCGVNGGADEAIDSALGLPSPTGNTSVLNSVFFLAEREAVEYARGEPVKQ